MSLPKIYYTYILANKPYGTLYMGVTNSAERRTFEHKNDIHEGFTKKYGVHMLVYYESHDNPSHAIQREKRIKRWRREWKIDLIESQNSDWKDLMGEI